MWLKGFSKTYFYFLRKAPTAPQESLEVKKILQEVDM